MGRKSYVVEPTTAATYPDIFGESKDDTIDNLLKGLRKDDVINFCSLVNAKHNSPNYDKWDFNFTNNLIIKLKDKAIIDSFNKLTKTTNQTPKVFLIVSSLRLLAYAFKNMSNDSNDILADADLRILKVFLILNKQITEPTNVLIDNSDKYSFKEKYIRALIPSYLFNAEFIAIKDPITQMIKFNLFCEYAANHYKAELNTFFQSRNVNNYIEYLKYLLTMQVLMHQGKDEISAGQVNTWLDYNNLDDKLRLFYKHYIINEHLTELQNSKGEDNDFRLFRKYPLYLSRENKLFVYNINFITDHIFQTVYFSIKQIIEDEKGKTKANILRSVYSAEFSQNILFKYAIDNTINNEGLLKQFTKTKRKEEFSDYYIRDKNKIYLFEFKDYLLSADLKYSLSYEKIADYFINRFVENAGLSQLTKVINKIEKGGFSFDNLNETKYFNDNSMVVFPIIVYSDLSFTVDGINDIINNSFNLIKFDEKFKFNVKSIVLIHLDFLIKREEVFTSRKVKFFDVLDSYIHFVQNIKKKSKEDDKVNPSEFITFEQYFFMYISKRNINIENPKDFMEIAKTITSG